MDYYVSLNGREFLVTLAERDGARRCRMRAEGSDMEVELVSRPEHGRPALVLVNGAVYRLGAAQWPKDGSTRARSAPRPTLINGHTTHVRVETELERRARPNRDRSAPSESQVRAPMPGRVVKVNVRAGDVIAAGAPLLAIEAMKMENELSAPCAGKIVKIAVQVGATVEADQELLVIEPG